MFMRSNRTLPSLAAMAVLGAAVLAAQEAPLPSGSVSINLPKDSPVAVLSLSSDQSRTMMRGAAMVLDLHMSLTLRNSGPNHIHGVTLRVVSQEVTMGGKGSVTIPSLNIGPGDVFPVRIDMQLVRPTQVAGGPLVEIDLDGVLFQDLGFYGPDRLNSRRYLTACELEAQRDREYFKRVLAQSGKDGLRRAMIGSLQLQAETPLTVKVRRGGPVVSAAATAGQLAQFAFVRVPGSPVEPLQGSAVISGNEAHAPFVEVRNTTSRPVKYVEVGWVVRDQGGHEYLAGSLPSSNLTFYVPAGHTARLAQDSTLSFTLAGQPVNIRQMTGFVTQVEFADGKVWVPSRESVDDPVLRKVMEPSAEEQRLSDLYRRKGIDTLIEELKKY
jgi:hypothetical protein